MRKLIHTFALSAITAAVLVACGGSGSDDAPPQNEAVPPSTPTESEGTRRAIPHDTEDPDVISKLSIMWYSGGGRLGDLRGTAVSTAVIWAGRTSAATAKLSLVDDTTGGASLTAQSGAPLGDIVNLQPGTSFFFGGSALPVYYSRYHSTQEDAGAGFNITFGSTAGWTVLKATVDLADGDVGNGITDNWSNLFAFAAGNPAFLWKVPAVISARPDSVIQMSQEGSIFSQISPSPTYSCNFKAFDTSGVGFAIQTGGIHVPSDLAAGDYPLAVAAKCNIIDSDCGIDVSGDWMCQEVVQPDSSEARVNITIRVTP